LEVLRESKHFCLHYLASNQEALSRLFSTKADSKFDEVRYSIGELGSPVLEGVVAASQCAVVGQYPGGDHTIIIGSVKSVTINGGSPLLYHRGRYAHLADQQKSA
jgi:flavin reductase (DIM6/NTAB) family NADH-FMN oxidoreductase RutF